MAAITWANVVSVAAELSTTDPVAQGFYLDLANTGINPDVFGGEEHARLRLARIYFAAHLATMDRQRGTATAGPVTREKRGGVEREYANLMTIESGGGDLGQTTYGQNYQALLRGSRARWPSVP